MPAVSVLIPAYNVERYLHKCLDSVLSQTFVNFEVILIDDGSTDGTGKICDDYAAKDSRIKVYHQGNKGISATRNLCLQHANGNYIQFVDSDDWIEPNMLDVMYSKAGECCADVVGCSFWDERESESEIVDTFYENKESFFYDILQNRWGVLWKLLIKKRVLTECKISFPQGVDGGEDFVFVTKTLFYASKVVCVRDVLYHYNRTNATSFISTPSYEKLMYQYEATNMVSSFVKEKMKYFDLHILDYRRFVVKRALLGNCFFKSFRFYPDIDLWAIKKVSGMKGKVLFFFSYLANFCMAVSVVSRVFRKNRLSQHQI